ncbi:unnamed protein product [Arctogadus glacialis]
MEQSWCSGGRPSLGVRGALRTQTGALGAVAVEMRSPARQRAPDPPLAHNQSSSHGGTFDTLRIPDEGFVLFVTFTFTEVTNDTKG